MTGYVFPNEIEVNWGLFIVLYPYITGLIAGAFIVSSLYHVFGKGELRPASRLSLLSALAFLFIAPVPLLLHLGQPLRALNIMFTPHLTSAMAGFGFIYSFYLVVCLLETWFMYRKDIVVFAQCKPGLLGRIYKLLSLGATDLSPEALHTDHKIVKILATIGIPSAFFLHGYVGFIFGSIKANPWWSTPLMPIIFLLSAIVSGVALLIVVYKVSCRLRKRKASLACVMSLNNYLWIFLLFATTLELLEVLHMGYEGKEEWDTIRTLLTQSIPQSYLGVQMGIGVLIPLILLPIGRWKKLSASVRQSITTACGVLVLIGVVAMRYNVVIGGQLISKSMTGYTQFHFTLLSAEGVLPTLGILSLPFMILIVLIRLLPPWLDDELEQEELTNVTPIRVGYDLKAQAK